MISAIIGLVSVLALAVHLRPQPITRSSREPRQPTRWQRKARMARSVERALPDAIDLFVLAVRAGHLPSVAVEAVLPHIAPILRPAFSEVATAVRGGTRFADALAVLPMRLGPGATPLVDSLIAADRYGLPLTPVLDRLAGEARQHRRRQADARARQLPVRLSLPLVLCTLPSFVLLAVAPLLLAALSSLNP